MRRPVTLAVIASMVAVLLPTGVGVAAYRHDSAQRERLPAGALVGGADVGGLTPAAARSAVAARLAADLDRPAVLRVGARTYTVTKRQLGVHADIDSAVATALEAGSQGSWWDRSWSRLRGGLARPRVAVAQTGIDEARVAAVVAQAVRAAAVAPVDARVASNRRGGLLFWRSRPGAALDPAAARAALLAAVADGKPRTVQPKQVAPARATIPTALLIRTGENRLHLYKNGRRVRTFAVATGDPEHPTPTGTWSIVARRYLPTWRNPGSAWAKNMPKKIPPGPNNPLGTRALNLDASGIRIHGTSAASSIGYSVSHGCIRMRMPDVEALYPMVPMDTPVIIERAGPPRLPGRGVSVSAAANAADGG